METLVSLFFHELYFPLSVGTCNRLNISILRKAIRCFSKTPFCLPKTTFLHAKTHPFATQKGGFQAHTPTPSPHKTNDAATFHPIYAIVS